MSTHNICFYGELSKLSFNYHQIPSLSVPLDYHQALLSSTTNFLILFFFFFFVGYKISHIINLGETR